MRVGKPDPLYHFDFAHREVIQAISDSVARAGRYKFVEINIVRILNPRRRALTFDVSYRPPAGEPVHLGAFGLYPADNPGNFIVPLSTQLQNDGAILVVVSSSDVWGRDDSIEVDVGPFYLRR